MAEPFRILLREGTAAEWTRANPVLGRGEAGVEIDTQKVKFGDGTTAWNAIPDGIDVNTAALAEDPQSELNRVLNATFATNSYVQEIAYGTNLEATDSTVATWVPDENTATGAAIAAAVAGAGMDSTEVDATVGTFVGDVGTTTGQKLAAFFAAISRTETRAVGQGELCVNAMDYITADGVTDDSAALLQAAADAGSGVLLFPNEATINVGASLKLAGLSCSIIGYGADVSGKGTTFVANAQDGPVLDFTDFNWPTSYRSAIAFGGFTVKGNGVGDPLKLNSGIKVKGVQGGNHAGAGAVVWGKVVVTDTGGPCMDMERAYLHEFRNVRLIQPIDARANNVPYFLGGNVSGCDMHLDLYCPNSSDPADEIGPAGGALVLTDNGGHASTKNKMNIRAENLHPPTDGTIIHLEANENFVELRHFDCVKEPGATGTSFIRLLDPPGAASHGGTEITGQIPGNNGAAAAVDYGVDVGQDKNSIVGVKGFDGNNVRLRVGTEYSFVELRGARAGGSAPGVVDESKSGTNTILDYMRYPGVGVADTARKATSTIRNNTGAVTDDPDLQVDVAANAEYTVEALLMYRATSTAHMKAGLSVPSGASLMFANDSPNTSTTSAGQVQLSRTVASIGNVVMGGVGDFIMGRFSGSLSTGATPGTVTVQWAQNNAEASDITMRSGSFLRVSRIA